MTYDLHAALDRVNEPPEPARNRLDPWFGPYAARSRGMRSSEIRAPFSVANRPEVVSLAVRAGTPTLGVPARTGSFVALFRPRTPMA